MAKVRYHFIRGKNYMFLPFDFVDEVLTKIANANQHNQLKYEQLKVLSLRVVRRTAWEEMKEYNFKIIPLTDDEFRYLSMELDNPI